MKKIIFLFLSLCLLTAVFAEEIRQPAPANLPNISREMKTPGFWISWHPAPDKVILTPEQINAMNFKTENKLFLTTDIEHTQLFSDGLKLSDGLKKQMNDFSKRNFYLRNGESANAAYYRSILENMDIGSLPPTIEVKYGITTFFTDQRVFPSEEGLFEDFNDLEIDELQNNAFDLGTPLAILHTSNDGKWFYAVSKYSSGWVKAENIALCSYQDLAIYLNPEEPVVIISPKADIYYDAAMTRIIDHVRMGARFPNYKDTGNAIIIPYRNPDGSLKNVFCFVRKEDTHKNFLPYTYRNIIQQAIKMLNMPYGWGDHAGEQDCSKFLQEVFATVGIALPRNSSYQIQVGKPVNSLEAAVGGATLLYFPGHIMLNLGTINGTPYVIHSLWGYRENKDGKDFLNLTARVVISDLTLGKTSAKKSLLERITKITILSD